MVTVAQNVPGASQQETSGQFRIVNGAMDETIQTDESEHQIAIIRELGEKSFASFSDDLLARRDHVVEGFRDIFYRLIDTAMTSTSLVKERMTEGVGKFGYVNIKASRVLKIFPHDKDL